MTLIESKPIKRNDCIGSECPCPWISCKHHMLWVMCPQTGRFQPEIIIEKFLNNHTDDEILEIMDNLSESCTLDVTSSGGLTLDQVGKIMGITRERVRQIEICKKGGAIKRLRYPSKLKYINDFRQNANTL